MRSSKHLLAVAAVWAVALVAAEPSSNTKPVFLYCRYFNAEGETRYLPDGTYRQVLQRLQTQFEVRVSQDALTDASLADVKVILISNPSDKVVGAPPAPHHFSPEDIGVLTRYVRNAVPKICRCQALRERRRDSL
jgi:hypothetical protein